jgi:hypothetical protein
MDIELSISITNKKNMVITRSSFTPPETMPADQLCRQG